MSDNQKNNNNNNHKKGENHRRNHETNSKPQSKQKPVKEPEATTGKKSSIEINQQKGNQKSHRDVPNVGQDSVPRKQQSSHADNEASNTERKPKDQYGKAHKRSESGEFMHDLFFFSLLPRFFIMM